jgi:four helix bundle protein
MAKIRPSGGYRDLRSFQIATVIYDATYWFCERFLEPRARMSDQMVQAARSGRQNIAEGSRASATSSQTELRLVNVARSSLEELLLDYEDYLRHRRLPQWAPESPEALAVRRVGKSDPSDRSRLIPTCPKCGKPMTLRTAQKGKSPGKQFWGCTGYPECKEIAEI